MDFIVEHWLKYNWPRLHPRPDDCYCLLNHESNPLNQIQNDFPALPNSYFCFIPRIPAFLAGCSSNCWMDRCPLQHFAGPGPNSWKQAAYFGDSGQYWSITVYLWSTCFLVHPRFYGHYWSLIFMRRVYKPSLIICYFLTKNCSLAWNVCQKTRWISFFRAPSGSASRDWTMPWNCHRLLKIWTAVKNQKLPALIAWTRLRWQVFQVEHYSYIVHQASFPSPCLPSKRQ